MEKAKIGPEREKGSSIRRIKVTAVYGEASLTECMKNVIIGKTCLKGRG